MSQKAKLIALLIFKIIALVAGVLLWVCGLIVFQNFLANESGILGWFMWGIFCLISMPIDLIKFLIKGAREGAVEGANTYRIKDYGSSISISNDPNGGALKGIITSALAMILVGPITLGFKIIANIFVVIQCIAAVKSCNN